MSRAIVIAVLVLFGLPATAIEPAPTPETLGLDSHQGKIVVVDFWASWCTPCRASFPWLNEMQSKYADRGLVVIGVNVDSEPKEALEFLKSTPASFTIVYDTHGDIASQFGVIAMPSSYVIDRQGQIAARHLGFKQAKRGEYEATLATLLDDETGATH